MASRRLCQHDHANSESHWTSTGASARKRKIIDVLGQESAENTRNGVGKRACLLNATISREEDVLGVGLNAGKVGRHVQSFSQVYTYDNASVHMGDRYGDGTTINHNYFGLGAAMNLRLTQDIEPSEEAAILRLAAVIIVAAIANVIVQPFLLLRNALCRAIPNAVQRHITPLSNLFGSQMVSFEDALGRFERIDINVVTDWTSFHYNLTRAFADQPGHRRVAVAGYRLFHHAQDSQLVDPRRPPPFASVFARNRHVRMSIHFAWDEVSLECCPKCGLKQTCELEKETICQAKACGFSYRGHIKDAPIVELDDEDDAGVSREERPSMDTTTEKRAKSRRHRLKNEQENPAWFSRISVSRQPEEISVPKSSTSPIFSGMSYTAPPQQVQSGSSNYNQQSYGQQSATQNYTGTSDTSRQTYSTTQQHQTSTEPSRYASPMHAVQAQQHQQQQQSRAGHSKQPSRSSNQHTSPVATRAPLQLNDHRQASASAEPANTTVDPSQVYDFRAEREKKAKAEGLAEPANTTVDPSQVYDFRAEREKKAKAEAERRRKMEEIEAAKKAEEARIAEEQRKADEAGAASPEAASLTSKSKTSLRERSYRSTSTNSICSLLTSGTSPMMHNSMQSPSYLPKMEAKYMKDYVCCDIRLDTMHELLQHYEEAHSAQRVQKTVRTPHGHQYPSSRAADAQAQAQAQAQAVQQQAQIYTATQKLYNHKKALGDFPNSRTRRHIVSTAHGNSSPLSVGSSESQNATNNFRTGFSAVANPNSGYWGDPSPAWFMPFNTDPPTPVDDIDWSIP